MLRLWLQELESLEAISQDDNTRDLLLRMATLAHSGRLAPFLVELDSDRDLDAATKASFTELAHDESFLNAVEDYVHRTRAFH
jgi:hypothetical protein